MNRTAGIMIGWVLILGGAVFPANAWEREGLICELKQEFDWEADSGIDLDTGETIVLSPSSATENARPGRKNKKNPPKTPTPIGGPELGGTFFPPEWTSMPTTPRGAKLKGPFFRPISGGYKSQGIHGRNAVDMATECGNPVVAAADGTIRIVHPNGWNSGYGKYVVMEHSNGIQTLYAHLSQVLVTAGQFVEQGWPIGLVGTTGNSTGCHLHFEVRGARNPF